MGQDVTRKRSPPGSPGGGAKREMLERRGAGRRERGQSEARDGHMRERRAMVREEAGARFASEPAAGSWARRDRVATYVASLLWPRVLLSFLRRALREHVIHVVEDRAQVLGAGVDVGEEESGSVSLARQKLLGEAEHQGRRLLSEQRGPPFHHRGVGLGLADEGCELFKPSADSFFG